MLYAKSLEELERMLELLLIELKKVGLSLNADKTKILHSSNADSGANYGFVNIGDEFIEILAIGTHHRHLGRHISLSPGEWVEIEISNRIRQAWAAFHKHSKIILNRHVSIDKRLKYFDVCVSPSLLFSLSSFPVPQSQLQRMDRLQRKMLRRIIGWRRIENESWRDTMKRMNDRLEAAQSRYYCIPWSEKFARAQWKFAIHLQSICEEAWASKMRTFSYPQIHDVAAEYLPNRELGRPCMRWDDYLKNFCKQMWPEFMNEHWSITLKRVNAIEYEDSFVAFVM